MRRIGITQRVDVIESYGERRDALDQRWYELVVALGCMPVPLPNIPRHLVRELMDGLNLAGVILSGGNNIAELDYHALDIATERDEFERALIQYTIETDIPLLGVCRGMQFINHHLGGSVVRIKGHVAVEHELIMLKREFDLPRTVNSFHHWAIPSNGLAHGLVPLAADTQGNIEAYMHKERNVVGIMWHPERVKTFDVRDINLLKRIFL
ncbi:gamma-glutamyl-gamma-aminobutyrate hydrolase family protein [Vibrio alfacsensis]|uniref:gamma-glutamyl-gamma-aminobutyrate hydrolase family protein n=1 Tax=Vibrio alfacsensis TaxID=1074311 RepID=UPI001BEDAE3B|nr:gamma-glutamyl-gamma-aminobutyrate hydrolase family protein [Vibrio alfacsensis]BCN27325.1 gamma-glutamyl-gamma-aminobutyrate hydrolase [Vibrio alfacsensis]